MSVRLSQGQMRSILREIELLAPQTKEIRIKNPERLQRVLVTLDAGWGTYSFYCTVDGVTRQAGMGESVEKEDEET